MGILSTQFFLIALLVLVVIELVGIILIVVRNVNLEGQVKLKNQAVEGLKERLQKTEDALTQLHQEDSSEADKTRITELEQLLESAKERITVLEGQLAEAQSNAEQWRQQAETLEKDGPRA